MYAWVKASVECPTLFECMRAVPNHDEGEVEVEQDVKVKVKVSGPAGGGGGRGGEREFSASGFRSGGGTSNIIHGLHYS